MVGLCKLDMGIISFSSVSGVRGNHFSLVEDISKASESSFVMECQNKGLTVRVQVSERD